jgi:hypothetical protein
MMQNKTRKKQQKTTIRKTKTTSKISNVEKLKYDDYLYILHYYKKPIPKNKNLSIRRKHTKDKALQILREKLCSCENKLKSSQPNHIPICIKSVLHRKGFRPTSFSCKNKTIKIKKDRSVIPV